MVNASRRRNEFFRNNGLLKGISRIKYTPLPLFLDKEMKNKIDTTSNEFILLIDFMEKVMEIDPIKRITTKECLNHEWFLEYHDKKNLCI